MAEKQGNPAFDKEPAEGSRETVEQSLEEQTQDQDQTQAQGQEHDGEQRKLPPRGEAAA